MKGPTISAPFACSSAGNQLMLYRCSPGPSLASVALGAFACARSVGAGWGRVDDGKRWATTDWPTLHAAAQ